MEGSGLPMVIGAALGFCIPIAINYFQSKKKQSVIENNEPLAPSTPKSFRIIPVGGFEEDCKMVICKAMYVDVNKQITLKCIDDAVVQGVMKAYSLHPEIVSFWYYNAQAKICVKIPNEEEMLGIIRSCEQHGIPCTSIKHDGKIIATACGPSPIPLIDTVTRHLQLY